MGVILKMEKSIYIDGVKVSNEDIGGGGGVTSVTYAELQT